MIKIKIYTKGLQSAIAEASYALPSKSSLSILEFFHFNGEDEKITITANDQNFLIHSKCAYEYVEDSSIAPFSFCINGKNLINFIKLINDEEIVIVIENNTVSFITGQGKYKFPVLAGDEYIDQSYWAGDEEVFCEITNNDLINITKRVGFAVADDQFKPAMSGYCFEKSNDKMKIIGTDSFKLSYTSVPVEYVGDLFQVILPKRFIDIMKQLNKDGTIALVSQINKLQSIRFYDDDQNFECYSRIIQEKYPPYSAVIPYDLPNYIIVDKVNLIRSVERVAKFSDEVTKSIRLTITDGQITIYGCDEESGSEASEVLFCNSSLLNPSENSLKFNGTNLKLGLTSLLNLSGDNIIMSWNLTNRPAIMEIEDKGHEDDLVLIMPMKG